MLIIIGLLVSVKLITDDMLYLCSSVSGTYKWYNSGVRMSYPVYTIEQTSSRHRASSSRLIGTPPLGSNIGS